MNGKIIEYDVIRVYHCGQFINRVNEAIKEGWQPIGGVSAGKDGEGDMAFDQAMVRYQLPSHSIEANSQ